jgi:nitrous oxidase accessory protein NosD
MLTKFVRNAFLPAAAAFLCMSASAATPVTQCGQKLNVQGETYEFTGNLNCSAAQVPTIYIIADDIKVNLKGFTFTGNGKAAGFVTSGPSGCLAVHGVELFNGTIMNTGRAVGVCVPGSAAVATRWHIHDLKIRGCGSGIFLSNANKNDIHHNLMERLTLVNPNPNSVKFGFGIELNNSDENLIGFNTISMANETGISIGFNSNDNDIKFNQIRNTQIGIRAVFGVKDNVVRGNSSLFSTVDMQDDNVTPPCGTNDWVRNTFTVANQFCIH